MKLENKILKISMVGALFFALFGIAWGWTAQCAYIGWAEKWIGSTDYYWFKKETSGYT